MTRPSLRIAPPRPAAYCSAWHCRDADAVHGARCCFCDREIALTDELRGLICACIYCGFDTGVVPAEEIPPGEPGPPFVPGRGYCGRRPIVLGVW